MNWPPQKKYTPLIGQPPTEIKNILTSRINPTPPNFSGCSQYGSGSSALDGVNPNLKKIQQYVISKTVSLSGNRFYFTPFTFTQHLLGKCQKIVWFTSSDQINLLTKN